MGRSVKTILRVLVVLVVLGPSVLRSQWTNITAGKVVPHRRGNTNGVGSTLVYRDGCIWIGHGPMLSMSSDLGATWNDRSPMGGNIIDDIDFLDRSNGVVGTDGAIYVTHDGGLTWRSTYNSAVQRCVSYISNPNQLVSRNSSSQPMISNDGGMSWQTGTEPVTTSYCTLIRGDRTGKLTYLSWNDDSRTSSLFVSSDLGSSWTQLGTSFDRDCWSFASDPCNPATIVVTNEETYSPTDNVGAIFVSTNKGASWQATNLVNDINYYCGSVSIAPGGVIFVQTKRNGVLRSSDYGVSWTAIGGPSGLTDSRILWAVTEDTVFAADSNGQVWMTVNSGGFPVTSPGGSGNSPLAFSTDTLFLNTLIAECDSARAVIFMKRPECSGVTVTQLTQQGSAGGDYHIVDNTSDSIVVEFLPSSIGSRPADLVVTMSNGMTKTIRLVAAARGALQLTFESDVQEKTDTIGGNVRIPVRIQGFDRSRSVEFNVSFHHDLKYDGAFSKTGVRLDVPGSTTATSTRLSIPTELMIPDSICAYLNFNVFVDSSSQSDVLIDALNVPSDVLQCDYLTNTQYTTLVIGPKGCGVQTISRFLHTGTMPTLRVYPNPASGTVTLESSESLGTVELEITSALGVSAFEKTFEAGTAKLFSIDLSAIPAGLYFIRLSQDGSVRSVPLVLER